MKTAFLRRGAPAIAALLLTACGSSSDDSSLACAETGSFACQTGKSEPLYTFQWALNYANSFFNQYPETFAGGIDLNVEPVHKRGFKGQGVNVLVLDSGADLHNEDLAPNADFSMSWNFIHNNSDPYPTDANPHGTAVSGIIAAAQNGKGVMGIAPLANLGAANLVHPQVQVDFNNQLKAHGGAIWSSKAHVFNASYGNDRWTFPYETTTTIPVTQTARSLKRLRDGKGAIFIKAAGNAFDEALCGLGPSYYDCTNPTNDLFTLESNIIVVAAMNTQGQASSYSSAGPVIWVTGMGGEYGNQGVYGEGVGARMVKDGPTMFSTDLSGCLTGYSQTSARTSFLRGQSARDGKPDNPNCDYGYMNGTSAAAPSISGVVALVLGANPELTWRDIRDILRLSARKVDRNYIHRTPEDGDKRYGALFDLSTNEPTDQMGGPNDIKANAKAFPMNLGWQTNGAGHEYSDWYGFGVPDAEAAVALALAYKSNPGRSRLQDVAIPEFRGVAYWHLNNPLDADEQEEANDVHQRENEPFPYRQVTSVGTFAWESQTVDQLQVVISGDQVCLGSIGIAAKSPSSTVSILKNPNDHFRAGLATGNRSVSQPINEFQYHAMTSYAFHGEPAQGNWEVFVIAANPDTPLFNVKERLSDGTIIERLSAKCTSTDDDGADKDYYFSVHARIVAQ